MKNILLLSIILLSSLTLAQVIGNENNTMMKLRFYTNQNLQDVVYETSYSRNFWNDNLRFTNSQNSIESTLKLSGEIIAGGLAGYGCSKMLENIFQPDNSIGENWLGILWQAGMVSIGAVFGSVGGTYIFGNLFGDEGSFTNTIYWSLISSSAFSLIGAVISKNDQDRLWITAAGLPVGATIGFNSNELFD